MFVERYHVVPHRDSPSAFLFLVGDRNFVGFKARMSFRKLEFPVVVAGRQIIVRLVTITLVINTHYDMEICEEQFTCSKSE